MILSYNKLLHKVILITFALLLYKVKNSFMAEKTTKTIKVQPKHRQLSFGNYKIVPWLTISGVWLEQNGFKAGDTVIITVEQNQLTIKTNEQ